MIVKELIGVIYPDSGQMQTTTFTFQYDKSECETEGYLWLEGYCFAIIKDNVRVIEKERINLGTGRIIEYLYIIHEIE